MDLRWIMGLLFSIGIVFSSCRSKQNEHNDSNFHVQHIHKEKDSLSGNKVVNIIPDLSSDSLYTDSRLGIGLRYDLKRTQYPLKLHLPPVNVDKFIDEIGKTPHTNLPFQRGVPLSNSHIITPFLEKEGKKALSDNRDVLSRFFSQIEIQDTITKHFPFSENGFHFYDLYFYKRLPSTNNQIECLLYKSCVRTKLGIPCSVVLVTYNTKSRKFLDSKVIIINGFNDDIGYAIGQMTIEKAGEIKTVSHIFDDIDRFTIKRSLKVTPSGKIKVTAFQIEKN